MDVKVDPSDDSEKSSFRMADKIGIGDGHPPKN